MKILILSQYFYPEINAPSHRWHYFANFLANKNHEITIICETPNYPKKEIFQNYKNKFFYREEIGRIKVIRTWVWITKKNNFFNRSLNYLSFFISSFFAAFRVSKPDFIIASSPPIFVIIAGYLISILRNIPLVTEIRDIWPDSVYEVGMAKKGFVFNLFEFLEKIIYKKSKKIIVNAKGLKDRLEKYKKVESKKIEVFINGAELKIFNDNINYLNIDKYYNLNKKFVVIYTGMIGLAQKPEIIVEAANLLKNNLNIIILIIGDGPLKIKCEKMAKNYNLKNIIFTGEKPRNQIPLFLSRANVTIIPYKNSDLFKDVIPSKVFDYMASGKPILINLDGEGAQIIKSANCGLVVSSENPKALADGIDYFFKNQDIALNMGKNGRIYAEKNFDKNRIVYQLEKSLKEILN